MPYDVTLLSLRPGATSKALPLIGEWLAAHKGRGELLACWYAEIGALNRVLLIRGYQDEASLAADRNWAGGESFGLGELLVGSESDTYVSFPFVEPIKPGARAERSEAREPGTHEHPIVRCFAAGVHGFRARRVAAPRNDGHRILTARAGAAATAKATAGRSPAPAQPASPRRTAKCRA